MTAKGKRALTTVGAVEKRDEERYDFQKRLTLFPPISIASFQCMVLQMKHMVLLLLLDTVQVARLSSFATFCALFAEREIITHTSPNLTASLLDYLNWSHFIFKGSCSFLSIAFYQHCHSYLASTVLFRVGSCAHPALKTCYCPPNESAFSVPLDSDDAA